MGAQDISTALLAGCLAQHLHTCLVGVMWCLPQAALMPTCSPESPWASCPQQPDQWGSPALRQVGGVPLAGSHTLPAHWGAPGLPLPLYSSSIHHPTQPYSMFLQALQPEWGAKRFFSAQCFHGAVF